MSITLAGKTYSADDFKDYGYRQTRIDYTGTPRPAWEAMWVDGLYELGNRIENVGLGFVTSVNATFDFGVLAVDGTGSVNVTLEVGKQYAVGMIVEFYAIDDVTKAFSTVCVSYSATTGVYVGTVLDKNASSGSFTRWKTTLGGRRGPTGSQGPQGPAGSGSSINVYTNGSSTGVATSLNFAGFTTSFAGGQYTVTVDLSAKADKSMANVTNTDFYSKAQSSGVFAASSTDVAFIEAILGSW